MASVNTVTTASNAVQSTIASASVTGFNATSIFLPHSSAKDLALLPLRIVAEADRFLFRTLPRTIVRVSGLNTLASRAFRAFHPAGPGAGAAQAAGMAQVADNTGGSWMDMLFDAFNASTNKSYWGMLHYATSRWAFTCFILALILNRVSVYGSSRQRIVLTWNKRLALRLIPCVLFMGQMHQLLQAIHCQTSPDFSLYRHGDNNKYNILDWSSDGGFLHDATSRLLLWSDAEKSCAAVGMSRPEPGVRAPYGSFSLLWPTFLRLSLSHLVENLSCSLQQLPAMTEVGLSVFEHSLAFAEAESMVAHTLNKKISKLANTTATASSMAATTTSEAPIPASGTILAITDFISSIFGPHVFDRINVPVEVLLVALLSCGNSLTSHLIAIIGKKQKWRLANTAFWGIAYMTAFVSGFLTESEMVRIDTGTPKPVSGLLHFPTVAIVGFLPHVAIIIGVVLCGLIYVLALLLTAVSLGTNPSIRQPTSLKERFGIAHDNLQAAVQLKSMNIRWYEDFYTALLRVGFAALTAASEAVFLNEGRAVEMRQFTWLEEERIDELDSSSPGRPADGAPFQIVEAYGLPGQSFTDCERQVDEWKSGYEKERKLDQDKTKKDKNSFIYPTPRADGVGALQRTTRFYLLMIFMRGIFFTIGGWFAYGIGALLDRLGITARPPWLRRVIGSSLKQSLHDRDELRDYEENRRFDEWNQLKGAPALNRDLDVDIEGDMRRKIASEHHENPQEVLDQRMYEWWKGGGWYGTKDESGEYVPSVQSLEQDDDATSVITTTTVASDTSDQQAWESEPEGSRTPTQRQYQSPSWSFARIRRRRSETPQSEAPLLDNSTLARLLNPPDKASRDEAKMLSSHLGATSGVMTRSRYRQQFEFDRSKLLLAGRGTLNINSRNPASVTRQPLSKDDEPHVLEQLLITRRLQKQKSRHNYSSTPGLTNTTAGSAQPPDSSSHALTGPACVICQTEPRTIIAWPCRCLTVCEDCRVNLAMNNFGNCVTCRRAVGGFVRLYVP